MIDVRSIGVSRQEHELYPNSVTTQVPSSSANHAFFKTCPDVSPKPSVAKHGGFLEMEVPQTIQSLDHDFVLNKHGDHNGSHFRACCGAHNVVSTRGVS